MSIVEWIKDFVNVFFVIFPLCFVFCCLIFWPRGNHLRFGKCLEGEIYLVCSSCSINGESSMICYDKLWEWCGNREYAILVVLDKEDPEPRESHSAEILHILHWMGAMGEHILHTVLHWNRGWFPCSIWVPWAQIHPRMANWTIWSTISNLLPFWKWKGRINN